MCLPSFCPADIDNTGSLDQEMEALKPTTSSQSTTDPIGSYPSEHKQKRKSNSINSQYKSKTRVPIGSVVLCEEVVGLRKEGGEDAIKLVVVLREWMSISNGDSSIWTWRG